MTNLAEEDRQRHEELREGLRELSRIGQEEGECRPDHRYNEAGDLEEFDNGPYEDEKRWTGIPERILGMPKLDPGSYLPEERPSSLPERITDPRPGGWPIREARAIAQRWTGDVLRGQLGLEPVPCVNHAAEENEGRDECMCFQCFKRRQREALDEHTREAFKPIEVASPWTERTLHCPSCRRELCTVECGSGAHVAVVKPCEGCQREGR
jgi:hypothetical protein